MNIVEQIAADWQNIAEGDKSKVPVTITDAIELITEQKPMALFFTKHGEARDRDSVTQAFINAAVERSGKISMTLVAHTLSIADALIAGRTSVIELVTDSIYEYHDRQPAKPSWTHQIHR